MSILKMYLNKRAYLIVVTNTYVLRIKQEADIPGKPNDEGRKRKIKIRYSTWTVVRSFEGQDRNVTHLHHVNPVPSSRTFSFVI